MSLLLGTKTEFHERDTFRRRRLQTEAVFGYSVSSSAIRYCRRTLYLSSAALARRIFRLSHEHAEKINIDVYLPTNQLRAVVLYTKRV